MQPVALIIASPPLLPVGAVLGWRSTWATRWTNREHYLGRERRNNLGEIRHQMAQKTNLFS